MTGLDGGLSGIDWGIVAGLLALATAIGVPLAGRQATMRDFFLGGRKLPWYAVCASIIATEIGAVTLISLPWVVFQPGGDITYLQLGLIGMVLARLIVAWLLVPAYYEQEIYSPYDYVARRLGARALPITTALFALGGVLAQSARAFLAAVALNVLLQRELALASELTGIPSLALSLGAIGLIAVVWTCLGGIAAVVWTDLVLFLVLATTPILALATIVGRLESGVGLLFEVGYGAHKLRLWSFDPSLAEPYTFWAAALAATCLGVGQLGGDQHVAQRVLCCRSVREARRAIVASSAGMLVVALIAMVGVGLFAYCERRPLEGAALELFRRDGERIFPIFVAQVVPAGLKGLVVAGVLAAAISGFDSMLAALSQTVLSAAYLPRRRRVLARLGLDPQAPDVARAEDRRAVRASRLLVLLFGALLCVAAAAPALASGAAGATLESARGAYRSSLDLALALGSYTSGALLAGVLLAFLKLRVDASGYAWSAPLSVMTVLALAWHEPWARATCALFGWACLALWLALRVLPDLSARRRAGLLPQTVLLLFGLATVVWLAGHGQVMVLGEIEGDAELVERTVAWPWFAPVGCTVALVYGYLLARPFEGRRKAATLRAP